MRLRPLLLLVAAVVIVPGFVAATMAMSQLQQAARESVKRELTETVRSTALLVDGEVKQAIGLTRALGLSPQMRAGDYAAFYEQARAASHPPMSWTLLIGADGRQIFNTRVPFGSPTPLPSLATRERIRQIIDSQSLHVSDVFTGPVSGQTVTTLYWPVRTDDGRDHVLALAFDVSHWQRTVIDPVDRPGMTVAVLDRAGRFIARNVDAAAGVGTFARPELIQAAAAASAAVGTVRHRTQEGMEADDGFVQSALTGWTVAVAAPVSLADQAATRAVLWLTAGVLLALLTALAAAAHLGRRFITAIDVASAQAVEIGQASPSRRPVPRNSITEVQALHDALAQAARVVEAERESRALAEQERHRLYVAEQALREAAEADNAAKDKYLAMLGHELRNPLAAISAASTLLGRGAPEVQSLDRFIAVIQRQTLHLTRVVDDLLDVARMMAGKVGIEPGPLELGRCVADCVEDLRRTPMAAGHLLTVQTEPVWVRGDGVRLEQVVSNLVSNALKYSPQGTEVVIRVSATATEAVIEVTDAGTGVPQELQDRIFQPFVQGPAQPGALSSGLGIGLALVEQLVVLHQGEVSVRNNDGGVGCTFHVRLPRVEAPHGSGHTRPQALAHGGRILLVEDNADAREAMHSLLDYQGYEVVEAADGEQALHLAELHRFDAVVLDIGLPGRDGYDVGQALRDRHGGGLRIIALSGYGQHARRAASAGLFDAFLTKPVEPEQLQAEIEKRHLSRLAG